MTFNPSVCANTKLIPGKLSICICMPIMIHNNAATEMCITKGQEGIIYAWWSHKLPNNKDVIDTLFVELANLPTPVKIDGLPQSVIPLTRTAIITNSKFPDDMSLTISRSQVEALPNFTMMDYASQGKLSHTMLWTLASLDLTKDITLPFPGVPWLPGL